MAWVVGRLSRNATWTDRQSLARLPRLNGSRDPIATSAAIERMNVSTGYPRSASRARSIVVSSLSSSASGDPKITLPLAMNVSTSPNPSARIDARRSDILTVCPPTLMARRNAT